MEPKEIAEFNCTPFFSEHKYAFSSYAKNRIRIRDPKDEAALPMNCNSIRRRAYFQTDDLYPEEAEFPIAFARTVYTLPLTLPHNFYCYALDSKSTPLFHKRMRALADCFPNVFLTDVEFSMDRHGHNMSYSYHQCMMILSKVEFKWKYLVLLQNYDIPLKTNQELIQIFKWFNGTNDIASVKLQPARIDPKANWTFEAMHLFRNETRNRVSHNGHKPVLPLTKSWDFVSVSRAMIDFMLEELDLRGFMRTLDQEHLLDVDEQFMGTLNSADAVDAPGGYTRFCYEKEFYHSQMTILVIWSREKCSPGFYRHHNCIFSVEQLKMLSTVPQLFGNKVMPSYDFGAAVCWYKELSRRTHVDRGLHRLKSEVYLNLPHVRFNRERNRLGSKFNINEFECKLKDEASNR
ncbi:Beta-1,3-galactosyl-O-glycosyl-glycoprotein beta-1,6-N-acetylglucosaminyltransferase 3 [Aphelenchoides besseyi]|nr:Beta-1,3-galactosyl-O-glycosyl-glycoprotein beta-1,6-N-acetylglucosaminyltransferase 3 [Aphelenchoides besseyi]